MPDRILLVQLADIGNLILTTPALAALREARPDAHLTLLTSAHAAPVLDDSLVDEVITFDKRLYNSSWALLFPSNFAEIWKLRRGNYDTVVFFHHFTLWLGTIKFWLIALCTQAQTIIGLDNGKGWFLTEKITDKGFGSKHEAQYGLQLVNALGASIKPRRAQVGTSHDILPIPLHRGRRVVIHAGSGGYSVARRWYPERFAKIADALHEEFEAQILLVGGTGDDADLVEKAMTAPAVNLSGRTSLPELADVIRSTDLYIGTDSGVMHVAAAVRVPVLAIFGPSNHKAWAPWSPGGQVVVLRSSPECSPCMYLEHSIGVREGCAARTCMHMVSTEMVLDAARKMLNDEPVESSPEVVRTITWPDRIHIMGLPVDRITYKRWLELIDEWIKGDTRAHHVCTTNPEFVVMAQHDELFWHILQRADLCLADGVGLMWAANWLKTPLPQRVTGSDGTVYIAEEGAKRGWKIFFLGAEDGIAQQAADILKERFDGLNIVGTYAGSPSPEDEHAIVERVNASGADILLVAYGAPQQDKWIARNLPRLEVSMAMGVGGSFDYIAGKVPRAPERMRQLGLEWLYRLYKQPWRIKRMMRLPRFVVGVIVRGAK